MRIGSSTRTASCNDGWRRSTIFPSRRRTGSITGPSAGGPTTTLGSATWVSSSYNRRGGEIAGGVEHRREQVGDRVYRDQYPDPFGRQAYRQEERREHEKRAAWDARRGERQEHTRHRDQPQLSHVERDTIEPGDEQRADGPRKRRRDLVH